MKKNIIPIGLGGVAGSLMRYGAGFLFGGAGQGFPIATLLINCLGCLSLGAFSEWIKHKNAPVWLPPAVETGVIGSFTTFSTFSVETMQLFAKGSYMVAIAYILLSILGGFAFAWFGHAWMHKKYGEARS